MSSIYSGSTMRPHPRLPSITSPISRGNPWIYRPDTIDPAPLSGTPSCGELEGGLGGRPYVPFTTSLASLVSRSSDDDSMLSRPGHGYEAQRTPSNIRCYSCGHNSSYWEVGYEKSTDLSNIVKFFSPPCEPGNFGKTIFKPTKEAEKHAANAEDSDDSAAFGSWTEEDNGCGKLYFEI